jgi:hypothetical protein
MARVKGFWVAALVAVVGQGAAVAQDAPTPLSPVPLFTQVCTGGGGHLARNAVRPASYADMPMEARNAIGFGAPGSSLVVDRVMVPTDVPNQMMKVGGNTYLLLPASGRSGALANSCAVAWKANDFDAARAAVYALAGVKTPPADGDFSPVQNAHIAEVDGPGFRLAASEIWGWTVLREEPIVDAAPANSVHATSTQATPGLKILDKANGETVVTPQ